jgi:hypothetical protein
MTEEQSFDQTLWNKYLLQQQELCKSLHVAHILTEPYQIIGLADDLTLIPLNGLRHPIKGDTAGWYIWTGEYNEADDFFKPVHAYHLLSTKPEIIKYLGLPVGYRFLIDNEGYEDVWFDETLLNVS